MSFAFRSKRPKDIWTITKDLYRQLNAAKFKGGTSVETRDFTPQYRGNEATIIMATRYKNSQQTVVNAPGVKLYRLPTEPDGLNLVLWNMCRQVGAEGNVIKDDSGFENHGTIFGSTTRTAGHVEGLDAVSANGTSDYYRIPNDGVINTLGGTTKMGAATGPGTVSAMTSMSGSCWFRPTDISLAGGKPRIVSTKVDLYSPTQGQLNGWSVTVEPDGTIWFAYKQGNTLRARPATRKITQMNIFYFLGWVITSIGGATPTVRLFVNGVESTEQTSGTKAPVFPTVDGGLDLFVNGTDEGVGIGRVNGATGDFRLWRNKGIVSTEFQNQFENKYTIADIEYVARAGDAFVAVEGEEGGGDPGEEPNTPPPIPIAASHSALSYSPDSHTIDEANINTPGGMGITGGTGHAVIDIPAQFFDSFRANPSFYGLTSLNQVSPDSKWKLVVLPGGTGFARTESYQHPGEQSPSNALRLSHGNASPIVITNTAKFGDFYARFSMRTISRTLSGDLDRAQFIFHYVDASNYYYLTLTTNNIQVRKVVAGTETAVGTGPTFTGVHPVGSINMVEVWVKEDGTKIEVAVDNNAASTKLTIGGNEGGAIPDAVASAVGFIGFRARNSNIMVDDIVVRPLLSTGFENGSPWSLTTAASISPDGRWKLEVAQGTGGQARTLTTGGGTYNNILDLRHGTASPVLLSQTTFTNTLMEWEGKTDSQLVVSQNNRLQVIFKWKDSSNFYYFVAHPSGWQIRRVIDGVDELRVTSNANGLADAVAFSSSMRYTLLVTNGGKDIELKKGETTTLYREEWGQIKLAATGGNNTETVSDDDNGVLAGVGKVGFKAVQSDCAVAYVTVFPS